MDDWKLPWSGGCRCGAVRVSVTGPPLLASACHCTGCQKMSASAFSLTLTLPSDGLQLVKGVPVLGGLSHDMHYFCPGCMSWMFTRPPGLSEIVNLRATMLDDPGWFQPYVELFTREKLPWAETGAPHSYEGVPAFAEFERLAREFAEQGARP